MSKYVLTVLDTTGIQAYIFSSNRLRENIGASYLVERATNDWVLKAIGVSKERLWEPIESSGLNAELIYAAGGNAMILFKSMDVAKEFTKKLSRKILEQAPGLNIVAAHSEFDWDEDKDKLWQKVEDLQEGELEKQKKARVPSVPLLGLGVTAFCKSTQLPAVDTSAGYIIGENLEPYLISRETREKLRATSVQEDEDANQAFRAKFEDVLNGYKFPYQIDDLGRSKGENSYYAVVHADGNSMGNRFKKYGENTENRDYVDRMRKLSNSVNDAGLRAVKKVIKDLVNSIENGKVMGQFSIKDNYLPLRPIVYGGDDITFICDGRLGLELAAIFLKEFQEQTVEDGKPLTACAGVSIVKSHYPFARAYQLSEALCSSAKKFVREQQKTLGKDWSCSAMDWHIAASGLFGSLGDIRQREYKKDKAADLTMRPIFINDEKEKNTEKISHSNRWRSWSNLTDVIQTFNNKEPWKGRRNKVMALREKLREGEEATEQFRTAYKIEELPTFSSRARKKGWTEGRCAYFDAIEAMEFYFSLNKNKGDVDDSLPPKNETT